MFVSAQTDPLPRSSPEAQGISSAEILAFIDRAEAEVDVLHSFILLRHGHVVAEGWWAPYGPERLHELHSLSKSFTSTAIGFAVDEGLIDLDRTVISFFPDKVPESAGDHLRSLRVRQLLNMTTGQESSVEFDGRDDWIEAFMESDFPHKPGTHWVYNSSASFMLSAILQQVTGQTVLEYLTPRLFDPLGIEGTNWEVNPQGINAGGWGLFARTRDIAALGQLYLQKGAWQGQQLLSRTWVDEATRKQASNGCEPGSDWDQGYGYHFWMCRHGHYRGDGAFGQFCIVMPEQDAVVAITSGTGDMAAVMNVVWEMLLPAMGDAPLVEDAALSATLQARLAGLRLPTQEGEADSPTADAVRGRTYELSDNPMGFLTAMLDFVDGEAALVLGTATAEHRLRAGYGEWVEGISNLSDRGPMPMPMAASGAWTDANTFVVKGYLTETAFRYSAVWRFEGDELWLRLEQNVGFGDTEPIVIRGQARSVR